MTWYGDSKSNPIFVASYSDITRYIANEGANNTSYRTELSRVSSEPVRVQLEDTLYRATPEILNHWLQKGGGNTYLENSGIDPADIFDPNVAAGFSQFAGQYYFFVPIEIWKSVSYDQYSNTGNISTKATYFCIAIPSPQEAGNSILEGTYGLEPGETRDPILYSVSYDPSRPDELIIEADYFYLEQSDIQDVESFLVRYVFDDNVEQTRLEIIERRVSFIPPPPSSQPTPSNTNGLVDLSQQAVSTSTRQSVIDVITTPRPTVGPNPDDIRFPGGLVGGPGGQLGNIDVAGSVNIGGGSGLI
jgi:hypothetical protein